MLYIIAKDWMFNEGKWNSLHMVSILRSLYLYGSEEELVTFDGSLWRTVLCKRHVPNWSKIFIKTITWTRENSWQFNADNDHDSSWTYYDGRLWFWAHLWVSPTTCSTGNKTLWKARLWWKWSFTTKTTFPWPHHHQDHHQQDQHHLQDSWGLPGLCSCNCTASLHHLLQPVWHFFLNSLSLSAPLRFLNWYFSTVWSYSGNLPTAFLNSMISVSKPSSSVTTSWSPGLKGNIVFSFQILGQSAIVLMCSNPSCFQNHYHLRFDSGVSWISSAAPLEGSMILPMNRGTSCSLS